MWAATTALAQAATYQSLLNHLAGNTWNSANNGYQVELFGNDPIAGTSEYNTYGNAPAGLFGAGVGGEFRVQRASSSNSTGQALTYSFGSAGLATGSDFVFKTFCLEHGQPITFDRPYYATIDPWAASGNRVFLLGDGVNTPPQYDPPSGQVKLLYGLYFERSDQLAASVPGFAFSDPLWVSALQEVIWHFEDAAPDGMPVLQASLSPEAQQLANFASAVYGDGYTYFDDKVGVLNLWSELLPGGKPTLSLDHQSQLIYTGNPAAQALSVTAIPLVNPEPGSLLIWAGLAALGAWRWRKNRTSSL